MVQQNDLRRSLSSSSSSLSFDEAEHRRLSSSPSPRKCLAPSPLDGSPKVSPPRNTVSHYSPVIAPKQSPKQSPRFSLRSSSSSSLLSSPKPDSSASSSPKPSPLLARKPPSSPKTLRPSEQSPKASRCRCYKTFFPLRH